MTAAGSQKNRGRGCPSNKESWENDVRTNLLFCIGVVAGCQRFICFDDAGGGQAGKIFTTLPQRPVVYPVRPSAGAAAGIVYFGDSFAQAKWQLLGKVWLAGMAAFFALHLLAYYRLSRRLSRGERHLSLSHAEQQEIRRVFYEIKSTLKIAAPVQLCISSQAAGPMLLGFLRPKVVFPDCMLPKENLRMIFRHELMHYRRRDSWYRLFLLFTLSVHWFNPILYLMVDSATEDLESACDRSVIKGRDRRFVEQYAQTLLDTAKFLLERQRRHQMLLASCLSNSAQRLKKRLIALFLPVGLNGRPLVLFAAVLMMLGIYIA